jgi:3D (Asp-Asp-Asp) domain-containing protein
MARARLVIAAVVLAAACRDPKPRRPEPGPALGTFKRTNYWITCQDEYPGAADTAIYDAACAVIATVPATFAASLDQQGTGKLSDGRVINYKDTCTCPRSPCFAEVGPDHPWGVGVENRPLQPYRSVAVDKAVIAYGTALWLPDLEGVTMPGDPPWGGFVHDGCVLAADTGAAIVGLHVDWFVGLRSSYQLLDQRLAETAVLHTGGTRCPDPADRARAAADVERSGLAANE